MSSLPLCLCRSWLQMCLGRGSLDLRRAVVGVLVRTALLVASSRTLKSISSTHQVYRSPLYISLFGMTWTQCQILVCGQYCPTLICHISSAEPACAGPKGNLQNSLKYHITCSLKCYIVPTGFLNTAYRYRVKCFFSYQADNFTCVISGAVSCSRDVFLVFTWGHLSCFMRPIRKSSWVFFSCPLFIICFVSQMVIEYLLLRQFQVLHTGCVPSFTPSLLVNHRQVEMLP